MQVATHAMWRPNMPTTIGVFCLVHKSDLYVEIKLVLTFLRKKKNAVVTYLKRIICIGIGLPQQARA